MRNRTRVIAAATAVSAALAAGGTAAAMASSGAHATTVSATVKPGAPPGNRGQDALVAAVVRELGLGTAQVSAALQPLFAAGQADTSSPVFAAAARSLGVSTQQLATALTDAKQSMAGGG
jgi:2-hydroxychromene-2-carboxylate isomerase